MFWIPRVGDSIRPADRRVVTYRLRGTRFWEASRRITSTFGGQDLGRESSFLFAESDQQRFTEGQVWLQCTAVLILLRPNNQCKKESRRQSLNAYCPDHVFSSPFLSQVKAFLADARPANARRPVSAPAHIESGGSIGGGLAVAGGSGGGGVDGVTRSRSRGRGGLEATRRPGTAGASLGRGGSGAFGDEYQVRHL